MRVDAELVGAGVQAELVGAQRTGDGGVAGQVGAQRVQVADVVDALLEAADVARRQADPAHAQPPQLGDDVEVLQVRGRRLRLVHRHLHLPRAVAVDAGQVAVHAHGVGHGAAVLGRARSQRLLVEGQRHAVRRRSVRPSKRARRSAGDDSRSAQGRASTLPVSSAAGGGVRRVVDVVAGVDGEEGVAGRDHDVDVGRRLEVVGVGAEAARASPPGRRPTWRRP